MNPEEAPLPVSEPNSNSTAWLDSIASRANTTAKHAKDILVAHGIHPTPTQATPTRLQVHRLTFTGTKTGTPAVDGPIDFTWRTPDSGLWAVLSDENLRGKTTVLELIKWLLRGHVSDTLQKDVRSWLHNVTLTFSLDQAKYTVDVTLDNNQPTGHLTHHQTETYEVTLAAFASDDEFETAMATLFKRRLELDTITTWNKSNEAATHHDWPAFAGALFIGTDYTSVLGDRHIPGFSQRNLLMYLGLPWIPTIASAKTAENRLQHQQSRRHALRDHTTAQRDNRRKALQQQLDDARAQLQQLPSSDEARKARATAGRELQEAQAALRTAREQERTAHTATDDASRAVLEDQRELRAIEEQQEATQLLRHLAPTACPRCEQPLTTERQQAEEETRRCFVCAEPLTTTDDPHSSHDRLRAQLRASRAAKKTAEANLKKCQTAAGNLEREITQLEQTCETLEAKQDSFTTQHALTLEIARLEARLQELHHLTSTPDDTPDEENDDLAIVTAALEETDNRARDLRAQVLEDVSTALVTLAQSFGMDAIIKAKLTAGGQLKITKGGQEIYYSKLTKGEQLRVKVAAVLAMLTVAQERGVGRHPGLLLIDSPRAQEVTEDDVSHLLSGIQAATAKLPHLQVLIASVASPALLKHIPHERRRYAQGDDYLW